MLSFLSVNQEYQLKHREKIYKHFITLEYFGSQFRALSFKY